TNKTTLAQAYASLLHDVYEEFKKQSSNSVAIVDKDDRELLEIVIGQDGPIWFPRRDTPEHMSRAEKDRYNSLVANLDKLAANATNPPPARAMVVRETAKPYEPYVFQRGNPSMPGQKVQRAFLRVLSGGEPSPFLNGSGRLELAAAITSSSNPLT